jgi:hypothetical protein
MYHVSNEHLAVDIIGARWDGSCYCSRAGEALTVDVQRAPGVWAGVEYHGGVYAPEHLTIGFAQAGRTQVVVVDAAGNRLEVPMLVEGPLQVRVEPLRTIASSQTGPVSDNTVGVTWDRDSDRWYFLYSGASNVGQVFRLKSLAPPAYAPEEMLEAHIAGKPRALIFSGPVHLDDASDAWLMTTLNQDYGRWDYEGGFSEYNYGDEGIALSTDRGKTWQHRGFYATHPVRYEDWLKAPQLYSTHGVGGSSSLLFVGNADGDGIDYLYTFPSVLRGPILGTEGSVANFVPATACRAPYQELLAALCNHEPIEPLWRKWKDGAFTSPYNGDADAIMPLGGYANQIVYCEPLGVYLALYACHETAHQIQLAWAPSFLRGPWYGGGLVLGFHEPDWYMGGPAFIVPGGVIRSRTFDVWVPAWNTATGEIRLLGTTLHLEA